MKRDDFVKASTTYRILESKMLSSAQLNRMVEAGSLEDAIKILNETAYQEDFSKLERLEDYEKALYESSKRLYEGLLEQSPEKDIVKLSLQKYNCHNLKIIIKDLLFSTDNKSLLLPYGDIDIDEAKGFNSGVEIDFDKYIEGANSLFKSLADEDDARNIELQVDRFIQSRTLEIAKGLKLDFFERYARSQIDGSNFISILRMKKQGRSLDEVDKVLVDGGYADIKTLKLVYNEEIETILEKFSQSKIYSFLKKALTKYTSSLKLSEFEKAIDEYLISSVGDTRFITYGPEVLFSYLIKMENEIKNIRIILVSKLNELEPDKIRERLRDINV